MTRCILLALLPLLLLSPAHAGGPEELQASALLVGTLTDALDAHTLALRGASPAARPALRELLGSTAREVLRTARFAPDPHSSKQAACQASTVYRLLPKRVQAAHPVPADELAAPDCNACDCLRILGEQHDLPVVWRWLR